MELKEGLAVLGFFLWPVLVVGSVVLVIRLCLWLKPRLRKQYHEGPQRMNIRWASRRCRVFPRP